ncbi:MAG: CPBP family intramembrane metalloprotease [Candidatus Helarchaeota archaeon]|nr:CPBP family intramembrane metalloprotease [Candidatus Helarchaeota archaeon]
MNVEKSNNEKPPIKRIQNPSGEWEREAKGRLWNFLEPVIMMSALQLLMWGLWFPLELQGKDTTIAFILIGVLALYLLISPIIHKDTSSSWGLGSPRYILNKIRKGATKNRIIALVVVITLITLTVLAINFLWIELVDNFLDIDPVQARQFQSSLPGTLLIISIGGLVGFIFALFIIRYDNFLKALKVSLIVIAILGTLLFLYSLTVSSLTVLLNFDLLNFLLNFFAYIFWGALQQILFASYFGTRFRKAFSPATRSNPEAKPKLWKKRLVVSMISGSYFGLIHVPAWYLLIFTTVLGVVISWLYMKDSNRNLIAIGVIHGFLGSLIGVFFASGAVEMTVGPSSVPSELVPNFWIVGIFLIIHQVIIVIIWYLVEFRKNKK